MDENCDVIHLTNEVLQTAKERLQELTEKEETIQKLSYEISELERRTLVPFKQTTHTDNTECWKFEEEIQKARNRLQKICNEIKSAFPELETHPANSRENELLRRSEYLLKEIDELSEKRTSMETIAECEKFVEEVKNVCDKPMTFCLDVVKMKKELAELGTISLELKDKEAKLQKVGS
jgi:division protein CdvB (Snf7/Vps24/ESCRT-III family)